MESKSFFFFSWLICSPDEADELQPDVMSFTAVIGAHARGSCVEGARELFLGKHLFMQGTNQRVVVSKMFVIFTRKLGEMLDDGLDHIFTKEIYPRLVVSNVFLNVHSYFGKWSNFDDHISSDGLVQPPRIFQKFTYNVGLDHWILHPEN